MLKRSTLTIMIASALFGSTLIVAAEKKESSVPSKDLLNEIVNTKPANNHISNCDSNAKDTRLLEEKQKVNDKYEKAKKYVDKCLNELETSVTKTIPVYKKNERGNAYDLSMTTITFKLNENVSLGEDFLKIDNELKDSKNLNDVFSKYGKIIKVENKVQSLVAGYNNSFGSTKTIEYVSEVTNGVKSHDFIDIINYQNVYLNDKLTENKLALFLDKKDSQLDSMDKVEVNDGSKKIFIERPVVSTHSIDQTVVLKAGEYKLINLSDWTTDESPLFNNLSNKTYRAIIVKVLEQGT